MPKSVTPITYLAEAALTQLIRRADDHLRLTTLDRGSKSVLSGRHLADTTHFRHANALSDLVAVVESFTVSRLLNLRPTVTDNDVATWEKRRKAWAMHGPVDLAASALWQPLMGFVETRNGIQHGLGRLTSRQLGGDHRATLAKVAAAGVRLNGDLLIVGTAEVDRCGDVCRQFVRFLDATAPKS